MELTKQQQEEYYVVCSFVEEFAKTWFVEDKQSWNGAITLNGQDVNEMSSTSEMSKTLLKNRLFNSDFHRNWIVNSWAIGRSHHHAKPMLNDACFSPLAVCDGDSGNINNDQLEAFSITMD